MSIKSYALLNQLCHTPPYILKPYNRQNVILYLGLSSVIYSLYTKQYLLILCYFHVKSNTEKYASTYFIMYYLQYKTLYLYIHKNQIFTFPLTAVGYFDCYKHLYHWL